MTKTPTYKKLATQLMLDIDHGVYSANMYLPSLRQFSALHQISMTTALACYRYVEAQGVIISQPKRGYYVVPKAEGSSVFTFPQFAAHIHSTAHLSPCINQPSQSLATAELDTALIDTTILQRAFAHATKGNQHIWGYANAKGEPQLVTALCHHFAQQGFAVNPNELTISHGCLDAVQLSLDVVSKQNDLILVSSPCYSGLLDILNALKRRVIEIPSTQNGLDLVQMEHVLKQHKVAACILTANHQNPTGHNLSNQQKQKIAALAQQYKTPVIEDDVFREISHTKIAPLPIKHFDKHGWVIWCGSVSKSLAAGLRLGWCAPGRFYNAYLLQRKVRTFGVNKPLQLALAHYITQGHYQKHLLTINRLMSQQTQQYIDFITAHFPKNTQLHTPIGGMVLWLKIPNINTNELAAQLALQHVYIKPGNDFSLTSLYSDCLRLNIGLVLSTHVHTQLILIAKHINKLVG
jgi:DNA-binding transcriptional MocR family regulator